jgi:F0F1-type ATP synthase membrane subunit b/b'
MILPFLHSVWTWIKKNWQWIIFPVGIVGVILAALASSKIQNVIPDTNKLDELEKEKEESLENADTLRDVALQKLTEEHADRLEELTEEQEKELEKLAEKPIEEVVAWFDKL